MGMGNQPDPRNISNPRQISFNAESWAAVVEEISAHKIGGLRFTSFRYTLCNRKPLCQYLSITNLSYQ